MMAKTQHLLFDVAEHFTQGSPETTYSNGKHETQLDCVFAKTAALRAVRRFEVSQEQMVPKHKLLLVEIDLETHTGPVVQLSIATPHHDDADENAAPADQRRPEPREQRRSQTHPHMQLSFAEDRVIGEWHGRVFFGGWVIVFGGWVTFSGGRVMVFGGWVMVIGWLGHGVWVVGSCMVLGGGRCWGERREGGSVGPWCLDGAGCSFFGAAPCLWHPALGATRQLSKSAGQIPRPVQDTRNDRFRCEFVPPISDPKPRPARLRQRKHHEPRVHKKFHDTATTCHAMTSSSSRSSPTETRTDGREVSPPRLGAAQFFVTSS